MSSYSGISLGAAGSSLPIYILPNSAQRYLPISSLGLICTVSSGASLTYKVQVTADPQGMSAPQNWNDHDTIVGKTGSANGNILYPVSAVRLVVTSWISGTVNLGVAQWP